MHMPAAQFLSQFPVNPADPILSDLQGNILKGHGRQFTFNLFLSFKTGQTNAVRTWIANFSSVFVTTARKQFDETQLFHDERIPGSIFTSFFLSAEGYKYLGVADKMPGVTTDKFRAGMKASGPALKDPNPSTWSPGLNGANGVIHAMVLIADADVHQARSLTRAIKLSLMGKADVVAVERGVVLRNAKGEGIEHNNYVDGISQPVFFANELPAPGDRTKWNPQATPSLMLVADPGGKDANSMGSYFVFRKLEQNVRGFKTREKEVAKAVFNLPANEATWTEAQAEQAELIGAWAVGRFEDGTPVMLHGDATNPPLGHQENNFDFADPNSASKCPFFAHIRKSAARTDGAGPVFNKDKRLVRRGIPFEDKPRIRDANGDLSDKPEDQPTGGVGLLFMCYVANIANQFEFVQQSWVNSPDFSQPGTGKDPLIGQPAGATVYHWPTGYGANTRKDVPFGDFITMRGGEYFFAPSLSMLQSLRPKPVITGTIAKTPSVAEQPGGPAMRNEQLLHQLNDETLFHLDPGLLQKVVVLDPMLQLFVPDKADVGAGVVNVHS
ncbi:hypothetical protein GO988_01835 [Hymenobacter sp. HMF4947]|uniref:Peroxidase n=1 Tax=Hymenobacter ginkgonis TaxID=2682976 RepID=A0A7K1T9I4_9BACT|nr:hypothetical protein [Hymenobacter ginkgonis]MVN75060.1 hypothetical protein [Hymenobacter ginkgonis]